MVSVEIKIVTTEADPYGRYHGKTVDKSLDGSFWDTQEDAIIKMTGAGFTHTQTVELAEGSHYVIYGNSAASSTPWHTQLFADGILIAEGDVYRGSQLRGDFSTNGEEPGWELYPPLYRGFEIWINVPDRNLYAAEIDGIWKYGTLTTIRLLIDAWLGPTEKKPTTLIIDVYPTSGTPPYDVMITAVIRSNSTALVGKYVSIYKNGSVLTSGNTDSGGKLERTDTVTAESSYYAYWVGDSEYEGCTTETITVSVIEPAPETYVVGVAMYEYATSEYVIGTLIVDGVRYTGERWKILVEVEEGVHTFNVEPPTGYNFVEWQVVEWTGAPISTSKARPLYVNIDRDIWIWAEVAREVEPVHALGIDVYPKTGYMGDNFFFSGLLMLNGAPVPYEAINLVLKDVGGVGSDTTNVDGVYEITWRADRAGSLRFHAEAPYLGSSSSETGVNVE